MIGMTLMMETVLDLYYVRVLKNDDESSRKYIRLVEDPVLTLLLNCSKTSDVRLGGSKT